MSYLVYGFILTTIYILYKGYELFKVPEHLKEVPRISFISFIRSFIHGEAFNERFDRLLKPTLKDKGYVMIWQQGAWELIVSDVASTKHIFNKTDIFLKKDKDNDNRKIMLAPKFLGESNIVTNDGEEWKRHRRVVNSAFKKTWPIELFSDCTNELISKIDEEESQPILIHDLLQRLTLDVLGKGLFSYDFQAVTKKGKGEMLTVYNQIMKGLFNPIYFILPILEKIVPTRQYYHHKLKEFRAFLLQIIKERKVEIEQEKSKDDLVTLMLKSMMESKEDSLSNEEVVNNLTTFFLAGHDTTANTLTSALYYLGKYPEIQDKLRQEIYDVLGEKGGFPSHEQQKSLNYLNCFIKENMRIIPTVGQLRRYCIKDEMLPNGLLIKKGMYVNLQLWGLHHDAKYFPNPEKFDPDRFLDPHGEQSNNWIPFGGGSRLCVGINFSLIEQRVILSLLLQRFEIKLGPNSKEWKKPLLTSGGLIYPKDLDVVFIKRGQL